MSRGSGPDDAEYYRNRALQEQVAAAKAQTPKAQMCHDELSMMYRFKAAMLSRGPESWEESLLDERKAKRCDAPDEQLRQ